MVEFTPLASAYDPGTPRVFVPFEDRKRDLTDLLGFGTVVQIFGSEVPWQLTTERVPAYLAAVRRYFRAHDVTDRDFIVAIGDPVVITLTALAAAEANAGRVTMLRWARLPCRYCDRYTPIKSCPNHERRGVYHPITLDALDDHSE